MESLLNFCLIEKDLQSFNSFNGYLVVKYKYKSIYNNISYLLQCFVYNNNFFDFYFL